MNRYKANSIELVSHCYCPPGVDQYAEHLKWQWASLLNYPPPVHTTLSVCFTPSDQVTMRRLENLRQSLLTHGCGTVSLQVVGMPAGQLFRRAIGRNWCAKRTKADVVHFCDVDYLFPPGYLGFLAENLDRTSTLHLPGYMRLNTFHAVGDELLKSMRDVDLPPMDLEDATKYKNWDDNERWSQRKQKLAIGGCQIVGGDLARTIGYLDGTPWVETVSESEGFRSCRCDKVFRRLNKLKAERLPICVYRLRHSTDGRDFSAAGQKLGKDVW